MLSLTVFADMSPLPLLIGGGLALVVICGFFLSLAVLIVSGIRRRRKRSKSTNLDEDRKK